jgi:hypothetical protein
MLDGQSLVPQRASLLQDELQAAIVAGVRQADPACEAFVGVVIERVDRDPDVMSNWAIKGIKFGKADRAKASRILATVVERMQQKFDLASRKHSERSRVSLWEPADAP